MDAAQDAVLALGVAGERVHTERFNMVQGELAVRHVQVTRLGWITAVLLVLACLVFAAARS